LAGPTDISYQKELKSREQLLSHLKKFRLDLKLTVGIWYFSPVRSRFHEDYGKKIDIEQSLEKIIDMKKYGVIGIEAHYPTEVNEDNIHLYKRVEKETGIKLYQVGAQIFYDNDYEFGSFSSPLDSSRNKAINILKNALKFVKMSGANHVGIWAGIDGYTYPLGNLYYHMWERFEDAVAIAMDEVPGIRVAIEPKPYEPSSNNIYRTTVDGLLACQDIERRLKAKENLNILLKENILVGMQPEIGHIRMGYEDTPYAFLRCARHGRLIHTHWNSQPLGNYDQDLNVGVVEWQQAEAALYALKMIGYKEYFGIDINPERMPVEKAIEINYKVLSIMNERIESLPHQDILECYFEPGKNRGNIELILARSMSKVK